MPGVNCQTESCPPVIRSARTHVNAGVNRALEKVIAADHRKAEEESNVVLIVR